MEPIFIDEGEAVEVLSNVFFSPIQFPHSATGEGKKVRRNLTHDDPGRLSLRKVVTWTSHAGWRQPLPKEGKLAGTQCSVHD